MLRSVLVCGLAMGVLGGCYTVEFDENKADVYYCTADADCLESQACQQTRCVDDSGPQIEITLPEKLTPIFQTDTTLDVDFNVTDFTISDSNSVVEGQGKVLVSIDDEMFSTVAVTEQGVALDISAGLPTGAHRLWVQAVYGDHTPYANPGASAYAVFFVEEQGSKRPQVAITSPSTNFVHVAGEPLEVSIAVRNYELVDNGGDCHVEDGCDPWNVDTPECIPACLLDDGVLLTPAGHAHIYIEENYPDCLLDQPIGCNGDYILSMRPSETVSVAAMGTEATAVIPADRLEVPGTYKFSVGLQYNDHDPFPNDDFIIYDQITLVVVQ